MFVLLTQQIWYRLNFEFFTLLLFNGRMHTHIYITNGCILWGTLKMYIFREMLACMQVESTYVRFHAVTINVQNARVICLRTI